MLLALTQAGLSREDSYALVQRNAMKVWESDGAAVAARPAQGRPRGHRAPVRRSELEALFDLDYHFRRIDVIFDRVFGR